MQMQTTTMSRMEMKPVKTNSDDQKYSGRVLCNRELMSLTNSSSSHEVYYGDTCVAIPFRWESQPGTPKVKFPERPLPPLTPPPSYLCSTPAKKYGSKNHSCRSSRILHNVLPFPKMINSKKCHHDPCRSPLSSSSSSSASSSPWSSSSYSPSTRRSSCRHESINSGSRMSFDSSGAEELAAAGGHGGDYESPVSTLCFGTFRSSSNARSSRGGCSAKVIKLLLGESM